MKPMAMILSSGVVAFIGLDGLQSRGYRRGPYPIVGGVIHLSYQTVFGWWAAVLAVTIQQCYLVYVAWCRDDV
jgi:hypothetical protein